MWQGEGVLYKEDVMNRVLTAFIIVCVIVGAAMCALSGMFVLREAWGLSLITAVSGLGVIGLIVFFAYCLGQKDALLHKLPDS